MLKAKTFRRGLKGYKKGSYGIDPPPQMFSQWILIDDKLLRSEILKDVRRAARFHNRLVKWASTKPANELIDAIGRLAWDASYLRSTLASASNDIGMFKAKAKHAKAAMAHRTELLSLGGRVKAAKSPLESARVEAENLWPSAKRHGWTAERYTMELQRKGHAVKQGTVAGWLTKLRNGEPVSAARRASRR
jgi:hypothetical protein